MIQKENNFIFLSQLTDFYLVLSINLIIFILHFLLVHLYRCKMELPNYSRQLMQQLHALRKEKQFCDCSILVGETPHPAHKLVLAASSMLFKSVLEGSDTISIDTDLLSSQEFSSLLDLVYTGKLPPGKHNFTRLIAAADSLQMFDVAVGCKNILTDLMKQTSVETNTEAMNSQVMKHEEQSKSEQLKMDKKSLQGK